MLLNYMVSATVMRVTAMIVSAYDLVVIEEEATPLAGGMHNYYYHTLVVIAILAVIGLIAVYLIKRNGYVKRLSELNVRLGRDEKAPFTIKDIKFKISDAESELAGQML